MNITLGRSAYGFTITPTDSLRAPVMVQTDHDYPGVASTFGWSVTELGGYLPQRPMTTRERATFHETGRDPRPDIVPCLHDGTDGTVDCEGCGETASNFIASARQWLDDHLGATTEDPGYFTEA